MASTYGLGGNPPSNNGGNGKNRTEEDSFLSPQSLIFMAISTVLYLAVFAVGYFNTKENGTEWWIVSLAAIACHIYLSIIVINERQLGAMFILGRSICDLKSGPHFAFWPLCYVRRETKNIIQLEIGVLNEEERTKASNLTSSESVYLLDDPFYLNWGSLKSATYEIYPEEERDQRKKNENARFKDDPLAKQMVTSTHLTIRFEIWSLSSLIRKAGSLPEAIELIQKAATSALISYAGKSFVARAIANMEEVDEWLKTTVEDFVADPDSKRYTEERSWGINVRKTQITRVGTAKRISEAQAEQGKTIYAAQGERVRLVEVAEGEAAATERKAIAEKKKLQEEGAGKADVEKLLLFARQEGISKLSEIAKTPEGQLILQLEALERGLREGKTVILPMELSRLVGALGEKFTSPAPEALKK